MPPTAALSMIPWGTDFCEFACTLMYFTFSMYIGIWMSHTTYTKTRCSLISKYIYCNSIDRNTQRVCAANGITVFWVGQSTFKRGGRGLQVCTFKYMPLQVPFPCMLSARSVPLSYNSTKFLFCITSSEINSASWDPHLYFHSLREVFKGYERIEFL